MQLRLEQMVRPFVLANRQREKANHIQHVFNLLTKNLKEKEVEQARDTELTRKELLKPVSNRERLEALMKVRDLIKEIELPSKEQIEWQEFVSCRIEMTARKLDKEKKANEKAKAKDWIKELDTFIARSKRENKDLDKAVKNVLKLEKRARKQVFPPAKSSMQKLQDRINSMEKSLIKNERAANSAKEELKQLLMRAASKLATEDVCKNSKELKTLTTAMQDLRRVLDDKDQETEKLCKDIDELIVVWNKQYTENKSPKETDADAKKAKAKLNQLVNPPVSYRNQIQPPADINDLTVLIRYAKQLREQLDKKDSDYEDLKWKVDCQISGWKKALTSLIEKETDA